MISSIRCHVQSNVTDTERHVVDTLYECVLITDGWALRPRWFLKPDLQTLVSCLCITPCIVYYVHYVVLCTVFFFASSYVLWYD